MYRRACTAPAREATRQGENEKGRIPKGANSHFSPFRAGLRIMVETALWDSSYESFDGSQEITKEGSGV